ncbi:unnamed protein product [Candidula unifasciata]|uniref:Uncharacterized protein n=1 Tax=Candidula unifasciata TaxID=100452 RepID=A0A8S3ZGY5_9EUPU|nr:unnamed protein product [Candidula unifasciata]
MLLYVCLILLPSAALGLCDYATVWDFFNILNANNDTGIDRAEAYAIFGVVDLNNDTRITIPEAQASFPQVAPALVGKEGQIVNFLDFNKDQAISYDDIEESFGRVDLGNDGIKSWDDYKIYLAKICGSAKSGS